MEPNLGENFANLLLVWYGSDWCAFRSPSATMFALHSKIYLVLLSLTLFAGQNATEWLLPHQPETVPQRSVTAASAQLLEALCLSLRQSSSFPYRRSTALLQQWAVAALSLHGVDSSN